MVHMISAMPVPCCFFLFFFPAGVWAENLRPRDKGGAGEGHVDAPPCSCSTSEENPEVVTLCSPQDGCSTMLGGAFAPSKYRMALTKPFCTSYSWSPPLAEPNHSLPFPLPLATPPAGACLQPLIPSLSLLPPCVSWYCVLWYCLSSVPREAVAAAPKGRQNIRKATGDRPICASAYPWRAS